MPESVANPHPSAELLRRFGSGELHGAEATAIQGHLETCEVCRRMVHNRAQEQPGGAEGGQRSVESTCAYSPDTSYPIDSVAGKLPARVGRYLIEQEIARGGMGQVVRVTDEVFQRPLAMKIALGRAQTTADTQERFVREALLTGQLQHPGIPPVQELGELEDGRPYFIMKLVKGSDLGKLLRQRVSAGEDLPRFVTIFEQICQTLGYAHSHGIIHRDLKPGNVMVGAFGEVQVMDWGLAKLLTPDSASRAELREQPGDKRNQARPSTVFTISTPNTLPQETMPGTVMGTSAYMPPEQARGEAETLDPRCDVFGLGAILCEVMTGKPPFAEKTSIENQRLSMKGDLSGAVARLDTCGADAELVDLAKRCLAPDRKDRPAHGGVVAEAVAHYQAALQERTKQAEIDKAAALVTVREERKRRRVTLALAATLVLLVVGGSIAGLAYQGQRARQNTLARLHERASSGARLEEMEALIAELEPLAPAEAAIARKNLYQRFADTLIDDLRQPQLGEEELARIDKALKKELAPRAPDLAEMVAREISAVQLAGFKKTLDVRLPNLEMTAAYLDDMEKLITAIAPVNPGHAKEARADLYRRYDKLISDELRLDKTLTLEDFARIDAGVALLKTRHPDLWTKLHQRAADRRGALQTVRVVEAPFDNALETLKVKPAATTDSFMLSPMKRPNDGPVVLLSDACRGNVQMEATFAYPSWGTATQLGLSLNASDYGRRGYAFLIGLAPASQAHMDPVAGPGKGPDKALPTLEAVRTTPNALVLEIQRNGVTLRKERLKVPLLAKALTLQATREGSRLTFELQQDKALVHASFGFEDVFATSSAASGVFALHWPHGVGLESLHLRRQALPSAPGLLQAADHLLAEEEVDKARALYHEHALNESHTAQLRQEARCKEAMCLVELKRTDEATKLLSALVGELKDNKGERWPLLAACELWQLYLQQNQRAKADDLADDLVALGFKKQLATVMSEKTRRAISASMQDEYSAYNFAMRPNDDKRLRSLERLVALYEYLPDPDMAQLAFRYQLCRAYRILGHPDKARKFLEDWLRGNTGDHQVTFLEELGWTYRELGKAELGLAPDGLIRQYLRTVPPRLAPGSNRLRIEIARLHVAMKNWQDAEVELDKYFEHVKTQRDDHVPFAAACLLRGFLHRRRGDEAAAQAAWSTRFVPREGDGLKSYSLSDPAVVWWSPSVKYAWVLGSLTNQLTGEQAEEHVIKVFPHDFRLAAKIIGFRLPTPLLRDAWQTPHGLAAAQHLAYQDLGLADDLKLPALVGMYAVGRDSILPAGQKISAEQDDLIWHLADEGWASLRAGTLTMGNLVQVGRSFQGKTSSATGWEALSEALKKQPTLRGPLAYVIGQRLLRLGQPEEAAKLFTTALGDAPADSPLRRLAEAALRRLKAK